MPEKSMDPWVAWEPCEHGQGAAALARLAGELPEYFAGARLIGSRWSRLSFYAASRLLELRFTRGRDAELIFVLHGPEGTLWLNGDSDPIHATNDAESFALTKSTAADYIRFFFYFVHGDEGAFVLIESPDEVAEVDIAEWREGQDETFVLEDIRTRASPLLMRDADMPGQWLCEALVAYAGALFATSLAVKSNGECEMLDDEPLAVLSAVAVVPEVPFLDLEELGESATGTVLTVAFEHNARLRSGPAVPGTAGLFVGRATEQDEFRRVLEIAKRAADPDEGHVVLIHGLGGIGKTTLLRRLHRAAGPSRRGGPLVAEVVDCEDERRRNRGDYEGPDGPPVWRLLDRLYAAVEAGAAGNRHLASQVETAFAGFRQASAARPDLLHRAAQLGIGMSFGRRRLSADQLSALVQAAGGVAKVAGAAVPGVSAVVDPVTGVARAFISASESRRDNRIDASTYDVLVAGLDRLVAQFASALKDLSRHAAPVVIFIDTGELLGEALLDWLREASRRSGSRVVWVLGLRLEAELDAEFDSEATRFRRSIHDSRLWSMPLTRFDDRTIGEYLRSRLGAGYPEALDIKAVARLTHGIPLAVSLVSQLLIDGQDPVSALAPVRDLDAARVVFELARRYLVHVRTNPALEEDLPLLYGLALLYGEVGRPGSAGSFPGSARLDPDALAALWDMPAKQVATSLDGLAARHDFVLSGSRRLHQEVRESVLLFLLEPVEFPAVRDMNARAAQLYRARADAAGHPRVDAQLADQSWQGAAIALLWHTFWTELDLGLRMLRGLFPAAAVLDDSFAAALLRAASFFAPACPAASQRLIGDMQLALRPPRIGRVKKARAAAAARDVIKALKSGPVEPLLATGSTVYYDLLKATWHETLDLPMADRAALLVRAAIDVEPGCTTAELITAQVRQLAFSAEEYRAAPVGVQQTIISALGLPARLGPDDAEAHAFLGGRLFELERYEDAEACYREATRLDPANAEYHNMLGVARSFLDRWGDSADAARDAVRLDPGNVYYLKNLASSAMSVPGRQEEAEAACREALRLDPDDAETRNVLGSALAFASRFDEAEAAYGEAVRLDPGSATYRANLGGALTGLGRYEEAEAAYRAAVDIDASDAETWKGHGYGLFRLGRYEEAEAAYREALRINASDAEACNALGRLYLRLPGRIDQAAGQLREALGLDPRYAHAHANLGSLYIASGELDAARASFLRAAQSYSVPEAFTELMLGALDCGSDPTAAQQRFTAALAAIERPYQPFILTPFARAETRALAMTALGRGQEAKAALECAVGKRSAADLFERPQYELFAASTMPIDITRLIEVWREIIAKDGTAAGPWGGPRPIETL
jgi:Flp pilus assembly protein TadD